MTEFLSKKVLSVVTWFCYSSSLMSTPPEQTPPPSKSTSTSSSRPSLTLTPS